MSFLMAFGSRRWPALSVALAFPLGLVVLAVAVLTLLATGIPYSLMSLGATACVLLVANTVVILRTPRADMGRWWRVAALGSLLFILSTVAICSVNFSVLSYDSHQMLMLGKGIGMHGGADARTWAEFGEWSAFLIALQSTAALLPVDYLYGLAPVLAVSFIALIAVQTRIALAELGCSGRSAIASVIVVSLLLPTTYLFSYHFFYVHTNLLSATFLFSFVSLWWLAESTKDETLIPPAVLALLGFSLVRMEAPIVAAIFLAMTAMPSLLSRKTIAGWLALWAGGMIAWYLLLLGHVPAESEFLSPGRLRVLLAGVFLTYLACIACQRESIQRLTRFIPPLALALVVLALFATFALKPDHMQISAWNFVKNLADVRYWSGFWYVAALGAVAAVFVPTAPHCRMLRYGVPIYMALILVLGYLRIPYRYSYTDSSNRMMLHIAPLVLMFFALTFVPLVVQRDRSS